MKNILLPTDFSPAADNAIQYALSMFDEEGCNFFVMNSYLIPASVGIDLQTAYSASYDAAKIGLETTTEQIKKANPDGNYTLQSALYPGNFSTSLNSAIEEHNIDFVVMGTTGASGLKKLIGTNAASAITHASCPLLVIPDDVNFNAPKTVGLLYDFKEIQDASILEPLKELVTKHNSFLEILNVYCTGETIGTNAIAGVTMLENLGDYIESEFCFVENEEIPKGVESYMESNKPDMLAAITHDRGFIQRIFHPSITKKIAMATTVPLLVLHEK